MSGALTRVEAGRFRVDFAKLRSRGLSALVSALTRRQPVEVDPYLVGQAVRAAMARCETRGVHGRRLVWNEYRIFLAEEDYRALLPLGDRLRAGLDAVIRRTLEEDLEADTVGDVVVRLLVDEEGGAAQGTGEIVAAFVRDAELSPEVAGEPTVRVERRLPGLLRAVTRRVGEPPVAGALHLSWDRGEARIPPFEKRRLGRPHPAAGGDFVPLVGANQRISSFQLAIENRRHEVVIRRPSGANPVQVTGRLVEPGGRLVVAEFPLEISLSNGELVLRLARVDDLPKTPGGDSHAADSG